MPRGQAYQEVGKVGKTHGSEGEEDNAWNRREAGPGRARGARPWIERLAAQQLLLPIGAVLLPIVVAEGIVRDGRLGPLGAD